MNLHLAGSPEQLCEAPISSPPGIQASHDLSQGACLIICSIWDRESLRALCFKLPVQPDVLGRRWTPLQATYPTSIEEILARQEFLGVIYLQLQGRESKSCPFLAASAMPVRKSNSHPRERRSLYPTGGVGHFCREAGAVEPIGKRGASSKGRNLRQLLRTLAQAPGPTLRRLEKGDFKTAGKKRGEKEKRKKRRKRNTHCYPPGTAHGTLYPADSPARMTAGTPPWHTGTGDKGMLRDGHLRDAQGSCRMGLGGGVRKMVIYFRV